MEAEGERLNYVGPSSASYTSSVISIVALPIFFTPFSLIS